MKSRQRRPRRADALKLVAGSVYVALMAVMGLGQASQSPPAPKPTPVISPEAARLLEILKQEQWADEQAPRLAAHELAEMGGEAARPIFRAMLGSSSNRALYWLEYALYRMAEQYVGRRDDARSPFTVFTATLDDPRESYDLRRLSARLLGKLGDGRAVTALGKNLSDRRVALDAARALGRIKTAESRQALVGRLAVADRALKLEIIEALGQLGDARALPALERVAASREAAARAAALEAMSRIRSPGTLARQSRSQSSRTSRTSRTSRRADAPGKTRTYTENFESGAARNWEPVNPEDWRVLREGANRVYALTRPFTVGVPRRPIQISLLKDESFADFTLTCRVRRPDPKMRSLILVFGYQDETHFYYAHLSSDSSVKAPVHNGLFIVDGAPRRRIGTVEADAILPDTDWRRIKIVREAGTGRIALYVDDRPTPSLEVVDHRFQWGRIGLGSFNEVGSFDDLTVTGTRRSGQ